MKITKKDFENMKAKYDKEVKKGKPAKGKDDKDKDNQTSWIFFNRATLERLLAKTDQEPEVGGIQFYFTEYTEETAEKFYPKEALEYTGQMTLVMRAANLKADKIREVELNEGDDEYQNRGYQCPYLCEPEPTES